VVADGVEQLLDRACPRCGAPVGRRCRKSALSKQPAERPHIARGWLDRRCPSCRAEPGEPCFSPSGREARAPHRGRWEQPRLAEQRYGYARVEADERDVDAVQHEALRAAGCVRIWTDRPAVVRSPPRQGELAGLLGFVRARDVLVVWRLDRLAPSVRALTDVAANLQARRIGLCSLSEGLDSTRPDGAKLYDVIAAIATLEHHAPDHDSPAAPRAPRSAGGRPALLDDQAHAAVRAMYDSGRHTIDEIAAAHRVSRPTVYRSLQRTRPTSQNTL